MRVVEQPNFCVCQVAVYIVQCAFAHNPEKMIPIVVLNAVFLIELCSSP